MSICGTRIRGIMTPATSLSCWQPKLPWSFSFDPRGQIFAASCLLTLRTHIRTKNRVGTTSHTSIASTHKNDICHQFHFHPSLYLSTSTMRNRMEQFYCRESLIRLNVCLRFRQTTKRFVGVHNRCAVSLPLLLFLDGTGLDPKAQTQHHQRKCWPSSEELDHMDQTGHRETSVNAEARTMNREH